MTSDSAGAELRSLSAWMADLVLARLSWATPLLLAAALLLSLLLWPGRLHAPPLLPPLLDLLFVFAIPLAAALLAGRGYAASGSPPLLLLGAGALSFSCAGLLGAWYWRTPGGSELAGAIYDLSALMAGICVFAAAMCALAGRAREQAPAARSRNLLLAGAGVIALLSLLTVARAGGVLPPLQVDGQPTALREAVLGLAVLTFFVSALASWFSHLRTAAGFFRWHALALTLVGLGLGALYVSPAGGAPITWAGRALQYLGLLYLLAAVGATVAEPSLPGARGGASLAALFRAAGIDHRALIEAAGEAIVLLDGQGTFRYANAAAERLLGAPDGRILGRPLREMVLPEKEGPPEEKLVFLEAGSSAAAPRTCELTLRRLDGAVLPAEVVVLTRPGGGAGQGPALLLRDLTDRKSTEETLRHHAHELRALAAQIADSEQRDRRRLAQLLHDGLMQLTVAAKLGLAPLEARAHDEREKEGIRRVAGLLDQAIAASRSLTLEISPPMLYDNGLPMALQWLANRFGEKYGLEVAARIDPGADTSSDSTRAHLFHAARELLLNVVRHAGVAEASLSLDQRDGWLVLRVADEGAGFSLDAARTRGAGFGLFGLRERFEALGGAVRIDTAAGEGTRVEVLAPPAVEAENEAATPVRPASASGQRRPIRRRGDPRAPGCLRILIVDDHAVVREGLASLLSEHPDLEVVGQVTDGDEALTAVALRQPDVVVMDVSMARMSGIEATRRLLAGRPGLRVIGLSMHDDGFIRAAMEEAGAVACLPKGGSMDHLIAVIRDRPGEEDPPPVIA